MKSLRDQMVAYGDYHQTLYTKATHFVGVPLVTFSLFVALSWLRLVHAPQWPVSAATLLYAVVFVYYVRLDWQIALCQLPVSLGLLVIADRVALLPPAVSGAVFGVAFALGWAIQLAGHALEGRRPALADNLFQVFNAPLFLTVEFLTTVGFRRDFTRSDRQMDEE